MKYRYLFGTWSSIVPDPFILTFVFTEGCIRLGMGSGAGENHTLTTHNNAQANRETNAHIKAFIKYSYTFFPSLNIKNIAKFIKLLQNLQLAGFTYHFKLKALVYKL